MSEKIPFLDMFPDCASLRDSCGGLEKAEVLDVLIERESMTMLLHTWFARMPAPVERTNIEQLLAAQFRLRGVQIQAEYPAPEQKKEEKKAKARVLMGKPIPKRADITPMNELTLESGNVTLEGEVFAVNSREIAKYGSAVLSFDMTDSTSSVRVSRFLRSDDDQTIVGMIHEGMWLRVQGKINYSKYDEDMVLEPRNIVQGEKVIRPDNAPQKRVELHLHTRYSALDAISDPADLVARAAYWGHPAIAVTDHGVAQAFPDMWKASKKYGVKIIYGEEGYLVNDVDGTLAVHGQSDLPLDAVPVQHPTQLYEALCYVATFGVLWWLYYRRDTGVRRPGLLFGVGLIGVFLTRFFIEFIKEDQEAFEQGMLLNMGQLLSIPFILFGIYMIWRALSRPAVEAKPASPGRKTKPARK